MSKVTIIPSDTYCAVDGVGYTGVNMGSVPADVHAVQWFGGSGWVEYVSNEDGSKPPNQPIDSLAPYQPVLDSWAVINEEHNKPVPPHVPTADENKATAMSRLTTTDWTQIPSVSDKAVSNPFLVNATEFAEYRNLLREIAVNPVAGDLVWPVKPDEIWETVTQ